MPGVLVQQWGRRNLVDKARTLGLIPAADA